MCRNFGKLQRIVCSGLLGLLLAFARAGGQQHIVHVHADDERFVVVRPGLFVDDIFWCVLSESLDGLEQIALVVCVHHEAFADHNGKQRMNNELLDGLQARIQIDSADDCFERIGKDRVAAVLERAGSAVAEHEERIELQLSRADRQRRFVHKPGTHFREFALEHFRMQRK